MVRIHQVTLSRAQLDAIPINERRLLVLIAHAANELNILSRLFHLSAKAHSRLPIFQQAENAQALVLSRLLTGKIYECWNLMLTAFFGTGLSKTYEAQLDAEAAQALADLKRYFGRENPIATVRNKHAFHYAPDQIDSGYGALVDGDPLEVYLAQANANTFFAFADTIAGRAMLESVKPGDPEGAFEVLITDTSKAVNRLSIVIGAMMVVCFKRHVGGDLYALGAKVIELEAMPDSQSVSIPCFLEITTDNDA